MSTKNIDKISPAQSRAARALLEITQTQLAIAANLSLSTVVDFERNRREVSHQAIDAIRTALEDFGVVFIEENGGGPGVRYVKTKQERKNRR